MRRKGSCMRLKGSRMRLKGSRMRLKGSQIRLKGSRMRHRGLTDEAQGLTDEAQRLTDEAQGLDLGLRELNAQGKRLTGVALGLDHEARALNAWGFQARRRGKTTQPRGLGTLMPGTSWMRGRWLSALTRRLHRRRRNRPDVRRPRHCNRPSAVVYRCRDRTRPQAAAVATHASEGNGRPTSTPRRAPPQAAPPTAIDGSSSPS